MTGSGTLADPYVIWDVFDLQAMENDLDAYYELGQDIDASATIGWNAGDGFDPVGKFDALHPEYAFFGSFDGKGYVISELYINWDLDEIGLFGLAHGATIRNVGLIDVDINSRIGTNWNIGALIGSIGAYLGISTTVENCYSTGTITGTEPGAYAGGLAGYMARGTVYQCYSTCNVNLISGGVNSAGGLVGSVYDGIVSQCFATGDVVETGVSVGTVMFGGLLGRLGWGAGIRDPLIVNCYARGNVIGADPLGHWNCGGFIGATGAGEVRNCYSTGAVNTPEGGFIQTDGCVVTNCFWDVETSGQLISQGGGIGLTTAEMKDSATFIGVGWGFGTIWGMIDICNNGYPCLLNVTPSCAWIVVPAVTTNVASNIQAETATLNGLLDDDGGEACACGFEWGATSALGNTTSTQSKVTGESFSRNIQGLTGGRTYYFRAFATNSEGTSYGSILSFTTKVGATVMTLPATHITESAARLHGKVIDDAGKMGDVRFQWGLTREYGANTSWVGGHVTGDEFEYALNNLTEGMGYHFRAQFKNPGIVSGQDMVFHTLSPVGPLILITEDQAYLLEASI